MSNEMDEFNKVNKILKIQFVLQKKNKIWGENLERCEVVNFVVSFKNLQIFSSFW